ncbi:MAG: SMC-Scp complex subunit ScpB, partial [Pseudomonadota bacterium]
LFQIRQDVSEYVSRLWEDKPQLYTLALLETLSLIAYRQPITRGDIEEIRGVSVSSQIMRTLQERDWVKVVGHRDVPGRPAMYATTRDFLDYFNLMSLDQLPSLSEIKSLDEMAKAADHELADAFAKVGLTAEDVMEEKRQQSQSEDAGENAEQTAQDDHATGATDEEGDDANETLNVSVTLKPDDDIIH